MELTQVVIGLAVAGIGIIGVVTAAVKLAVHQSEQALNGERQARHDLIESLRRDLKIERDEREKAEGRERDLVRKVEAGARNIAELQASLTTTINEMAALRIEVTKLQAELDAERDENKRLTKADADKALRIIDLDRQLARVTIERDTLRDLIRSKLNGHDIAEPAEAAPERAEAAGVMQEAE